jgi:hypothetical protein
VSHPDGLPDLFVDRSLGRLQVPRLLRAAGLRLTTLAERYGIPADETVADADWLREAGTRGEAVFMKDERVRYNVAEKAAIGDHAVRAFCLTRGDLDAASMAGLFLDHLQRITAACADEAGLFVVNRRGIRRVDLG